MCTLIAFHRVWADAPLVLAVNRDEAYGRPSRPPEWVEGDPRILAPRDERAGGTWMGANSAGVWVGLTNRRPANRQAPGEGPPAERRSRGLLCLDLLSSTRLDAVVEALSALREPYDPFHLIAGDGRSLWRVDHEEGELDARELAAGCHLVTNRPPGEARDEPKVARARALLEAADLWPAPESGAAPPDLEARLANVLADHGRDGPDALCLHGGLYGTRSAAVWRIAPGGPGEPPRIDLAFADGPPCSTRFGPGGRGDVSARTSEPR